jgi:hypothetical protein
MLEMMLFQMETRISWIFQSSMVLEPIAGPLETAPPVAKRQPIRVAAPRNSQP